METVLLLLGLGISFTFGRITKPAPEVVLAVEGFPVKTARVASPIIVAVNKAGDIEVRGAKPSAFNDMEPFKRDWIWGGYKVDCQTDCSE